MLFSFQFSVAFVMKWVPLILCIIERTLHSSFSVSVGPLGPGAHKVFLSCLRASLEEMGFDSKHELKSRDITLPTKVHLVKAMVFPVVMYGCESWTIKKADC